VKDPAVALALSVIDSINRRDVEGLARKMSANHSLEIFGEPPLVGKDANTRGVATFRLAVLSDREREVLELMAEGPVLAHLLAPATAHKTERHTFRLGWGCRDGPKLPQYCHVGS
jgi:hypothetical protein